MKLRLRDLRVAAGINQADLARQIGASQRQISAWERGVNEMSLSDACKLADYFSCSLDTLIGRDPSSIPGKDVDAFRFDSIREHYRRFNPQTREEVYRFVSHISFDPSTRDSEPRE